MFRSYGGFGEFKDFSANFNEHAIRKIQCGFYRYIVRRSNAGGTDEDISGSVTLWDDYQWLTIDAHAGADSDCSQGVDGR